MIEYRRAEEVGGVKAKCKVGNTKTRFYLSVSGTHVLTTTMKGFLVTLSSDQT